METHDLVARLRKMADAERHTSYVVADLLREAAAALAAPPAAPLYEYCPSCRRLGPLFGLAAIRSEETGGRHCVSCFGIKTESRLLPLWTAPPAAPPADLVALVREYQEASDEWHALPDECDDDLVERVGNRLGQLHEKLLAYPLPAAPPVTDTPQGCEWHTDDDGMWHTSCGRTWEFINDGPAENRMHYCMGCGRKVDVPTHPPQETP